MILVHVAVGRNIKIVVEKTYRYTKYYDKVITKK